MKIFRKGDEWFHDEAATKPVVDWNGNAIVSERWTYGALEIETRPFLTQWGWSSCQFDIKTQKLVAIADATCMETDWPHIGVPTIGPIEDRGE